MSQNKIHLCSFESGRCTVCGATPEEFKKSMDKWNPEPIYPRSPTNEQVERLIRTLEDMGLPLAIIAISAFIGTIAITVRLFFK